MKIKSNKTSELIFNLNEDGSIVISVPKYLDISGWEDFIESVKHFFSEGEMKFESIIFDMRDIVLFDSVGLWAFINLNKKLLLKSNGQKLVLRNINDNNKRILDLVKIKEMFVIE